MISFDGKHVILESQEHGRLTLEKWKLVPCDAASIDKYFSGEPFQLEFYDVSVVEDTSITNLRVMATYPVLASSASIVQGGWLPPSLALLNSYAFADRNFVAEIFSRYENGKLKKSSTVSNFENLEEIPFSLDIIPYAVESNINEIPGRAVIEEQIREVVAKVQKALPKISITQYDGIGLAEYVEKLVNYLRPQIESRQNFFFEFSKEFHGKVARGRVRDNWERIVDLASTCSLRLNDFAVLIGLLVVASKPTSWPGVRIIKPGDNYTMAEAHNAACDVGLFELLLNMRKMYPKYNYVALSGDKHLIKLGALLSSSKYIGGDGGGASYGASIPLYLFDGDVELAEDFAKIIGRA
jgi:hypothetical protein